jgi:hypothetical protein
MVAFIGTPLLSPPRRYTVALNSNMKIRSRRFSGRCARHKSYNPAVDGRGGIKGNCARCVLLCDIWETALRLNALIRRYDPKYDDVQAPFSAAQPDSRQMSLLEGLPVP